MTAPPLTRTQFWLAFLPWIALCSILAAVLPHHWRTSENVPIHWPVPPLSNDPSPVTCTLTFGSMQADASPLRADAETAKACTNASGHPWVLLSVALWTQTGSATIALRFPGEAMLPLRPASCVGEAGTWTSCQFAQQDWPIIHSAVSPVLSSLGQGPVCYRWPCSLEGVLIEADGEVRMVQVVVRLLPLVDKDDETGGPP